MQQALDVSLIRQPFGCGKFVCDEQIGRTQPDTDMSCLGSRKQSTNGAGPLLVGDFGNVDEVDCFVGHCRESFQFLFLFLSWHNVSVPSRTVWAIVRMAMPSVLPRLCQRSSPSTFRSGKETKCGSSKPSFAVSKLIPCLTALIRFLVSSHSNNTATCMHSVARLGGIVAARRGCRDESRHGRHECPRHVAAPERNDLWLFPPKTRGAVADPIR